MCKNPAKASRGWNSDLSEEDSAIKEGQREAGIGSKGHGHRSKPPVPSTGMKTNQTVFLGEAVFLLD